MEIHERIDREWFDHFLKWLAQRMEDGYDIKWETYPILDVSPFGGWFKVSNLTHRPRDSYERRQLLSDTSNYEIMKYSHFTMDTRDNFLSHFYVSMSVESMYFALEANKHFVKVGQDPNARLWNDRKL